ncbi:MAG: mechanosensitive ion channel [Bacteroidaceae bacterium]|nr:mechanosensitive ion channel [Bacteroidaceae bacterium]
MTKRIFLLAALLLIFITPADSVLKEKDLARTLGVLKAELQANYEQQQAFMQSYEQQGMQQHQQLVWYMHQCEQIGLMLYSQSTDNTFDMAYACQQAANLKRDLDNRNSKMRQYDKIIARLKQEIERTDNLIRSLKRMPPVIDADSILSASDSVLLQAIDSLASKKDSLLVARNSMDEESVEILEEENNEIPEEEEDNLEPLFLTRAQQKDRNACLLFADTIRNNMQHFLENLEAENAYYQSVREKVHELDEFAQSRYKLLQDNIFRNGGANYFRILASLPMQIMMVKSTIDMKYKPFEGHGKLYSEWRGATVLFISIFLIFYLALSLGISYIVLRWLLPKKWRGPDFKTKRMMLNNIVGIALFAIIVMLLRATVQRNFIQMGTGLIINIAWLLEAIFLSLYVRLKGDQMRHAAIIYMPLMLLSFIVILFRIVLIPNALVNLIFPPILLAFSIWQYFVSKHHRQYLPMLDKFYTNITTAAMFFACVAAWIGYTLLAVQVMIWWTFQLAAIMTITFIYDLTKKYESRYLLKHLGANLTSTSERLDLLKRVKKGDFIDQTWFYDLFCKTLVPILAVASVLVSIYWAAEVFEMTSLCQKVFKKDLVNLTGLIRISLYRICMAAALFFIFRYINYAIRSFYLHYKKQYVGSNEAINKTLARNIIAIVCWGLYIIIVLVLFRVPKGGISIVSAGLATGLGFAMQSILENFFYGISLMSGRIHVGDYIECDGVAGKVESISYQSTQITTNDGSVITFLNSALFGKTFKNMTRNHRYELIKVPVGVAYGTDVEQVRQLLVEALQPICKEKTENGQTLTDTNNPVTVAFSDFGESSVDLKVCVWMLVEQKLAITARVKEIIYNTLNKNNIEIPFPQRDLHIHQQVIGSKPSVEDKQP